MTEQDQPRPAYPGPTAPYGAPDETPYAAAESAAAPGLSEPAAPYGEASYLQSNVPLDQPTWTGTPAGDPAYVAADGPPAATVATDETFVAAVKPRRLLKTRARVGGFVRHRLTQVLAALIIGLGLGAGGMALILHNDDDSSVSTSNQAHTDGGNHGDFGGGHGRR